MITDIKKGKTSFISRYLEGRFLYSPEGNSLFNWVMGVFKALRISKRGDVIVCWFDFQAVLCYWIGALTFQKRNIVCINVMLKDKNTIRNRVVAFMYRKALSSKRLVASVSSEEYGKYVMNRLHIKKKKFFLLHDVFHEYYKVSDIPVYKPNTVFCGGKNGREWNLIIRVAKLLPNVTFNLVMPGDVYNSLRGDIPNNIIVKHDIPSDEFLHVMCESQIVALPLNTQAPSGLIVIFQAAANNKFIVTSDTLTTREYISNDRGLILRNDAALWAEAIQDSLSHPLDMEKAQKKMLAFLRSNCSEEQFINVLNHMISEF